MFLISSDIRKGEGCPGCKYGRCIHLKPKKKKKTIKTKLVTCLSVSQERRGRQDLWASAKCSTDGKGYKYIWKHMTV